MNYSALFKHKLLCQKIKLYYFHFPTKVRALKASHLKVQWFYKKKYKNYIKI